MPIKCQGYNSQCHDVVLFYQDKNNNQNKIYFSILILADSQGKTKDVQKTFLRDTNDFIVKGAS